MNSLVVAVAQYLLFLILVAAAVIWLFLPRPDKVGLAMQAVVSLAIAVVLVKLAGAVHADPRPFVVDPSIKPWFAHPADNGFPSDHTAVAATVALVVTTYRKLLLRVPGSPAATTTAPDCSLCIASTTSKP